MISTGNQVQFRSVCSTVGAMSWQQSNDVEQFVTAAGPLLLRDPCLHTIALTQVENVRARPDGTRFAWWTAADQVVTGAALLAPGFPALLCAAPSDAIAPLMHLWQPAQVSGSTSLAVQAAVTAAAGRSVTVTGAERLFRLAELQTPEVSGSVRTACEQDRDLVLRWFTAFVEEAKRPVREIPRLVADRLAAGHFLLWEDQRLPRSLAATSRPAFGTIRVGPVYTPPGGTRPRVRRGGHRGDHPKGARLRASRIVLFTDLTNPTSNALYPRLGFVPLEDRAVLQISPL